MDRQAVTPPGGQELELAGVLEAMRRALARTLQPCFVAV